MKLEDLLDMKRIGKYDEDYLKIFKELKNRKNEVFTVDEIVEMFPEIRKEKIKWILLYLESIYEIGRLKIGGDSFFGSWNVVLKGIRMLKNRERERRKELLRAER